MHIDHTDFLDSFTVFVFVVVQSWTELLAWVIRTCTSLNLVLIPFCHYRRNYPITKIQQFEQCYHRNFTYMAKHYNFRFMLSFLLMFKCPCKCNMTQRWFSTQIFLWGLLVYLFCWKLISGGNIYRIPFQIMVCVVKFFEIRKQWFWTVACIMPLPCISFISPLRIHKYMSNT